MARGSGNGNGKGRARKGRPVRARKAEAAWRLEKKRYPSYLPDAGIYFRRGFKSELVQPSFHKRRIASISSSRSFLVFLVFVFLW